MISVLVMMMMVTAKLGFMMTVFGVVMLFDVLSPKRRGRVGEMDFFFALRRMTKSEVFCGAFFETKGLSAPLLNPVESAFLNEQASVRVG